MMETIANKLGLNISAKAIGNAVANIASGVVIVAGMSILFWMLFCVNG